MSKLRIVKQTFGTVDQFRVEILDGHYATGDRLWWQLIGHPAIFKTELDAPARLSRWLNPPAPPPITVLLEVDDAQPAKCSL